MVEPQEAIEKLAKMYAECFSSGAGAWVLEDLKRTYNDDTLVNVYQKEPIDMVKVVGKECQRAVYLRILQLMEKAKEFTLKEPGMIPLTDVEIAIAAKQITLTEAEDVPIGDI